MVTALDIKLQHLYQQRFPLVQTRFLQHWRANMNDAAEFLLDVGGIKPVIADLMEAASKNDIQMVARLLDQVLL